MDAFRRASILLRKVFQNFGGDVHRSIRREDKRGIERAVGRDIEDERKSVGVSAGGYAVADVAEEARSCIRGVGVRWMSSNETI